MDLSIVVYVMVGLPCSGKSTWAFKHLDYANTARISTDDIIDEAAAVLSCTYNELWPKAIEFAQRAIHTDAIEYIKAKSPIIWDQTNLSWAKRQTILNFFKDTNYKKVAVHFEKPSFELFQERNSQRKGKVIPEDVWLNMAKNYVPPTLDEGFDRIINVGTNGEIQRVDSYHPTINTPS